MYLETIENVVKLGVKKSKFLKENPSKYFVFSILAGFFVGISFLLVLTIGGFASPTLGYPVAKILMGAGFGIALSLVMMAGSELFTGSNMILTVSTLEGETTWKDTIKLWITCYLGNFVGSILCAGLFYLTKTTPLTGEVGKFIIKMGIVKSSPDFISLFTKGIFCNIFVCLAVWCCIKLTSESGKLIMIWWCLFAFLVLGFEHSVANMTLFSFLCLDKPEFLGLMVKNLVPVTLGNIVGGAALGAAYFYGSKVKK